MRAVRTALLVATLILPIAGVQAAAAEPPAPVFENGEAQPVFDPNDVVEESLYVTAPVDSDDDGEQDRVHVEIVRPKATEQGMKAPVVFQASPYFAGTNDVPNHDVDTELHVPDGPATTGVGEDGELTDARHDERLAVASQKRISWAYEQYLLARGYAVVYGESLGSGGSTGCPTTGAQNETIGSKSVIDWLNGRAKAQDEQGQEVAAEWSTGKTAMTGVSYNGTLPNAVASTGVEGLEAIVPIAAISNWYDYYRANGSMVSPGGFQGEDADVLARFVHSREDREICKPVIDQLEKDEDRVTGDYGPFWDERNYLNDVDKVHAAVLAVHGLNDWNVKTKQAAQWYAALRDKDVPHKIWWHQGGHEDPISIRKDEWLRTMNRWFTKYLFGVDNGVQNEPKATIQREDSSWVDEPEWPAPQAEEVTLHPSEGGSERGGLGAGAATNQPVEKLTDDAGKSVPDLVSAPKSPNRLAYVTKPATEPMRISGTPSVDLSLAFDRPAANVTAALVDQAPDGTTSVITRGWIDPQNREGIDKTTPIEPGTQYEMNVDLQPKDYVLPEGHSLGLAVLSSDQEFTLRPKPGVELALDLSATQLRVPVVGDPASWS